MKKWLKITLGVLLVAGVTTLLAFVSSRPKTINCYDVEVKIMGDPEALFVNEQEILDNFKSFCVNEVSEEELQLNEIESFIDVNPSVKKSNVFKNVNGSITIEVELKKVIGRIINKSGNSFYIDEEGNMMPLVDGKPARVVVINGEIIEGYSEQPYYLQDDSLASQSIIDDVYRMVSFIDKDPFWKAQIEQIYVNEERKFILIPKVGMHEILFGDANHIEGKFKKLELFYKSGISRVGWEKYSTIDIQYRGQVIGIENKQAWIPAIDTTTTDTLNDRQTLQ